MIYNKYNLLIQELASKDNIKRPVLNSIRFAKDYTEATDGYYLIRVAYPEVNREEMPTSDNPEAKNIEPIIPLEAINNALKSLPINQKLPILENGWITKPKNSKNIELVSTNLTVTKIQQVKPLEAEYPNTEQVFKNLKKPKATIYLSAKRCKKLFSTLTQLNSEKYTDTLKISVYGREDAVKVETTTEQGQKVTAALMPMRVEEK